MFIIEDIHALGSKPNVSEISQDSNPKNNSSTNKSNISLHQNNSSPPKNDIHPKKISAEYKFSQENEPTQESNISLDTKLEYTNLDVLCERGSRASLHTGLSIIYEYMCHLSIYFFSFICKTLELRIVHVLNQLLFINFK